jgi:hydrogenase maturation protease
VMLDAFRRAGPPGSLYVLEPEIPDISGLDAHAQRAYLADTHYATPLRALAFAAALGKLPRVVRIVGCEPEDAERFEARLSAPVEAAVARAIDLTIDLAHRLAADLAHPAES